MSDLNHVISEAIDDLKGQDIVILDVSDKTDVTDTLVIATGTSNRHVKSLADNVVEECKKQLSQEPIGVEGKDEGEWVLVDFGDTVVHVMQAQTRDMYDLEKLWSVTTDKREQQQ